MQDDTESINDVIKSKSQLKREMQALQELGEELVKLPKEQFEKIVLSEELHDAVLQARNITQHGAHKRQLQYIGKLMRNIDPEPVKEQLNLIKGHSARATQTLHNIEQWRDQLLTDGDHAVEKLLEQHPQTDRQYLRQLLRNAHKEIKANKPPKSKRLLFQYLREILSADE